MSNQISILGNLQNGVLMMNQPSVSFPTNPTPGMLVINGLDLYAYITVAGVLKWYPIVQKNLTPSSYVGTENTSSIVWVVQHNLNTSQYYYQVKDSNGAFITPNQLIQVDNNSFKLVFNTPVSGSVLVLCTSNLEIDQFAIGDGSNLRITRSDQEQLNFVAGVGITLEFNNVTKAITINAGTTVIQNNVALLETSLNDEIVRAMNAENGIALIASNESVRALSVEQIITSNLNAEVSQRSIDVSTLTSQLTSEVHRAEAAEGVLHSDIVTEILRASNAENILTNTLNSLSATVTNNLVNTSNAIPLSFGNVVTGSLVSSDISVNQIVDSFSTAMYRTVRYTIQVTAGLQYQASEILCIHDGSIAYISEISDMYTGGVPLAVFDAEIVSGNFHLLVSPTVVGIDVKLMRSALIL